MKSHLMVENKISCVLSSPSYHIKVKVDIISAKNTYIHKYKIMFPTFSNLSSILMKTRFLIAFCIETAMMFLYHTNRNMPIMKEY